MSKRRKGKKREPEEPDLPQRDLSWLPIVAVAVFFVALLLAAASMQEPVENGDNGGSNGNGNGKPDGYKAPVARAWASHTEVFTNTKVMFDGSRSYDSDGTVKNWTWIVYEFFLDQPVKERFYGRKVNHSFEEPGRYYIVLEVRDNDNLANSTVHENDYGGLTVVVKNRIPVPVVDEVRTGRVGEEIVFDSTGSYDEDGEIVAFRWDFGDNGTASGANVTHLFGETGHYTVCLEIEDDHGDVARFEMEVAIS
jgi:hypothetical protein